jgi:hypothetical protein
LVYRLVSAVRKDPDFITKIKWSEMKKLQKHDAVVMEVIKHLDSKTPIEKASEISQWLFVTKNLEITNDLVRSILRKEFGLLYRKVKKNSYLCNSDRNLVLR